MGICGFRLIFRGLRDGASWRTLPGLHGRIGSPYRSGRSQRWIKSKNAAAPAVVAIFALAASRSAQAQMTVDVTKINCDQFVHHKISEPRLIAAWLSGYYNAKRNNRVIDLQTFEENMSKVIPIIAATSRVCDSQRLPNNRDL